MIPSTVLQEAVTLLTVAMDAKHTSDLRALVAEFQARDDPEELLLAVVGLCRSLCLASSKLIHTLDDTLTNSEADELTDAQLLPIAMQVVQRYAAAAAQRAEEGRE